MCRLKHHIAQALAYILVVTAIPICIIMGNSCNPFAPEYDPTGFDDIDLLGDLTTIDGYFTRFKNAYELRDTLFYGELFAGDFLFEYWDAEQNQNISWDRATEMSTSYNLFQSVQQINLDWNYMELDTTDTEAAIVRNFNLTIVEDEQNVYVGTGRARFRLRRDQPGDSWKAFYWFDDSDF